MDIFYSGKKRVIAAAMITCLFCITMVTFPSMVLESARRAINLWMTDVLPALLPFFICANFLQNIGVTSMLKPGIFPFVMSVLSGYPMGAKIVGDLRRNGDVSLDEAKRLMSFCSTSGPAFIIGAVGAGMMGSDKIGAVIACAHYAGALINGYVYSGISDKNVASESSVNSCDHISRPKYADRSMQDIFTESILMSLKSLGIILAYIVMFMLAVDLIETGGVFSLFDEQWIGVLMKGFFEMTVGCEAASNAGLSQEALCVICSGIISWGGLSIIGQSISMLAGTGISAGYILLTKSTHGLFSAAVAFVIATIML